MLRNLVVVTAIGLALAGCSSSGGGDTSTPPSTSVASSSASDPAATALAAKIRNGVSGLSSAHLVVDAGILGTSSGDVKYSGGKASASRLIVGTGADRSTIVTVGGTSYAKLPAGRVTGGKPWAEVSTDSSNEFVRALASQLDIITAASSLPAIADVAATATSVKASGTHYSMIIEPTRAANTTLGPLLASTGQKQVPTEVDLDSKGRPTKIALSVKIGTQSFDVTIGVSRFDAPLTITAPPASQVAS